MNQPKANKDLLRRTLRTRRAAIDAKSRTSAALSGMQHLATNPVFKNARHIACYLAQGSEFDLQPVIQLIWQNHKKCYLPVLTKPSEKSLHFVAYAPDEDLQVNCHGIQEPVFASDKEIPLSQLDLVLVPLIGFDRAGHRLGSGSGYYDRAFAFLTTEPRPTHPVFIGVGFATQESDELPHDAWDVRLDGILTEQELLLLFGDVE